MKHLMKYIAVLAAFAVLAGCAPAPTAAPATSAPAVVSAPATSAPPPTSVPVPTVVQPASVPTATSAPAPATAAPTSAPSAKGKICMVTDAGGIDDKAFSATAWQGAQLAGKKLGWDAIYLESRQQTDYDKNINEFVNSKCDLIVTVGFLMGDAVKAAAQKNPNQKFQILDVAYDPPRVAGRTTLIGRVAIERETVQEYEAKDLQRLGGYRTMLGVPLMRDGFPIGVFVLTRNEVRPFSLRQIELVQTFADQAVIAIENVRLFNETTDSLERQTATSEVMKAISGTAFDLAGVLHTVIAYASQLTEAENGFVYQVDGDLLAMRASFGERADVMREWQREHPIRTDHTGSATGRAFAERRTIHIPDVDADPTYTYADAKRLGGFRVLLAVPLISSNRAIGVIALWRTALRPFSQEQIRLVESFADQAVIAIENARLFNETTESLERQTAVSDILKVISASPTDIQPVLDAIASSAARFANAEDASVLLVRGDQAVPSAHHGPVSMASASPLDRASVTGRATSSGYRAGCRTSRRSGDPGSADDCLDGRHGRRRVPTEQGVRAG